jgi:DNA-binding XRE family transcriptional regulator
MRPFLLVRDGDEGPLGEGVEFFNGSVVICWYAGETVSRFADVDSLRSVLPDCALHPIHQPPMAERLRAARMDAGLSQRALAREVGMSFSTISRIERGEKYVINPRLEEWLSAQEA